MGAQSLQKTRHETAFEYFMRESIKAINLLPDAVEWPFRTESPRHGIHALWKDSFIHNGLEYSEYHKTLRRLHGLGLLLVCYSTFLQGDHERERSAGNYEIRTIPIIYFLIPRGEQSDRFIHQLESNTELNVCVWDAKDQFTAGPSDELSKKNVKGKNFEWRIERSWDGEDPSWDRPLVEPFEYDSKEDSRVKEFLENDNPYFCVVGMNINSNDYREDDPCMFLKKIKDFDLVEHIEQAKKLSEDGLAGAHEEVNHEKDDCGNYRKSFEELSGLPSKGEAKKPSEDGSLAGAYTQLNDKKVEELSGLPSKEEAKKSSEDGSAWQGLMRR
ncbi:hypothetical protein FOMG_17402 [Fusarium oxysporum f. sp. melonis 26406]|uniref:Uncharacterized protein n=1 Tax=Fusarium oxysporum f. sp. melonis 26406 TaxID=1089452 RepID=W9ZBQ8_FUSOX|nr:hypothetical protein FOMG_17402 [Fusarium oxysporum f. sp. melonis 26406]